MDNENGSAGAAVAVASNNGKSIIFFFFRASESKRIDAAPYLCRFSFVISFGLFVFCLFYIVDLFFVRSFSPSLRHMHV